MIVLITSKTYSQEAKITTKTFNGFWKKTTDDEVYYIFKEGNLLSIIDNISYDNTLYVKKLIYGFCDERYKKGLMSDNLKEQEYVSNYVLKTEQSDENRFLVIDYKDVGVFTYEIEFSNLEFTLFGSKVFTYYKTGKLPVVLENRLRQECKKQNIDSEYFLLQNMTKVKITTAKSTLYKIPNTPTKMYLVKGNEVEVVEQKDNWLKVRYYGKKTIEGWVKKEDVE